MNFITHKTVGIILNISYYLRIKLNVRAGMLSSCFSSCCIFRTVFGCYAPKTLVEIVIFSVFSAKKQEIWRKFLQKTRFFKFPPERWSTVLFPKNSQPATCFLQKFAANFLFFLAFLQKKRCKWLIWPAFFDPNTGRNIQQVWSLSKTSRFKLDLILIDLKV